MTNYFLSFITQPAYAVESGIPNSQASTLIGMMSVGSTFGRLFFGRLCDHPKVNRLYVFQMAFLIIGIADTLSTLTHSYAGLVVYMVVFGVFDGCYVVLLAVICADIVGVDKVSSGIGIQFFFMSITAIAGPPLAGKETFPCCNWSEILRLGDRPFNLFLAGEDWAWGFGKITSNNGKDLLLGFEEKRVMLVKKIDVNANTAKKNFLQPSL